jgi:hypothetical protein
MANDLPLKNLLEKIKDAIISYYGEKLLAAVIYGSVARSDYRERSDIDLLLIIKHSKDSLGRRIDEFMKLDAVIRKTPEYISAKAERFPHKIEPIILTLEEFKEHPPLLLDLTTDSIVLYEKEQSYTKEMDKLRKRLRELGAKKVILEDGRWYWILKPGLKKGEVVVI